MYGPVLTGVGVALRPPDDSDAARFVEWFSDLEVTRYLLRRFAVGQLQEEGFLKTVGESSTDVFWMLEADGRPIGATGIHQIDWLHAHGTTGIVIGVKEKWGRGIATEVMRLRTAYAFDQLNLRKLMTEVFVENAASRRALEKNGYRTVGTHREHFFTRGKWHDIWLGEVLRTEWESTRR